MFVKYTQLNSLQKIMVEDKIVVRINASKTVIKEVLKIINPPVKIVEKEVILMYDMLQRIEREVRNVEG
ncbi:hypothetical protein [Aquimarina sediminis]|uniref:hypothetical protein n=1 Tax=Aquimarina sediminis TaxID=2070536 RepID=UPI000FFE527C|nr:hypothetical protein [Aquimarina sediminis]